MADTPREPLFSVGRPPRPDATWVRQFVSAGLALLTAVALPRGEIAHSAGMDIPNPQKKVDSPLARDRQRINDLPRQLEVRLAGKTAGMELPRPPRLAPETLFPDIALLRTPVVAATLPFAQGDWGLAKRVDSPLARERWLPGLLPVQTARYPFAQYDWSLLARRADSPQARDRQRVNDLSRQTALPFAQFDWPLTDRVPLATPETPPTNVAVIRTVVVVQPPFASLDWPLAKRRPLAAPETLPLDVAAVRTPVVVQAPFQQVDWPLAKTTGKPRPAESPHLNRETRSAGPAPFAFFDWRLPQRVKLVSKPPIPANVEPINAPIVPVAVTLAATEAPDTAAFSLAYWGPIPPPSGIWVVQVPPGSIWTVIPPENSS